MKVDTAPILRRGGPPAAAAGPSDRIRNVPDRSVVLVGHRHLLSGVHRTLLAGRRALLCPAEGRAGSGATTAMIEFAHRHAGDHDIAWWIPAADPELVPIQLAELAETLGLARATDDAEAATARLLDALRHRGRYLLVFDDAANPRQLARFLPTGSGDTVIISSDPGWQEYAIAHPVEPFTRSESVALLCARRPDLSADAACRVAAALEDLPLAVDCAAALLAGTGMDVDHLLRRLPDLAYRYGRSDPTAAIWNMTFDHLAAEDPPTLALLTLVAWLGPDPLPLHLVTGHPHVLPRILADTVRNPAALARLTTDLRRRGPARIGPDGVALHPVPAALLAARTIGEHLGVGADWAGVALRLLRAAVPDDPDDPATWPTWRRLLPLVLTATDPARHLDAATADAGRLLRGAACYLDARGQRHTAVTLSRDADGLCAAAAGRVRSAERPAVRVRPGRASPRALEA